MIYADLIQNLEERKERKDSGKFNSILFPFERFGEKFIGFEKGKYGIITANSGIGKTKISKFLTVISVYRFCKKYNIPFCVKYFALEETETDFWLSMISIILSSKYGKLVDIQELKSLGNSSLTKETLNQIKEIESIVNDMMNYIKVYDYISNGFGIYKEVREYARSNGKFYLKGKEISEGDFYDTYIPNNPEEHVLIVLDHVSLLIEEKNYETEEKMNHWQSLGHWSKNYALKYICKRFNYTYIGIQQQESAKEKQEYNKGQTIVEKLEPSLDGLSTNKELQREADWVLGLFAPDRFEIHNYRGYDIAKLQDTFRTLKVLKDRHYGTANTYVPLFMNGVTNEFYELPKAGEMRAEDYEFYLKKVRKKIS